MSKWLLPLWSNMKTTRPNISLRISRRRRGICIPCVNLFCRSPGAGRWKTNTHRHKTTRYVGRTLSPYPYFGPKAACMWFRRYERRKYMNIMSSRAYPLGSNSGFPRGSKISSAATDILSSSQSHRRISTQSALSCLPRDLGMPWTIRSSPPIQ